ncbi:hypothetical protein Tco_0409335 [Tanacetum coccineum]
MAGLEFCSKHNMVAYLEKTDGNTEFHQIMDFLTRSSIYYALTVSPIVSTSFVEQFWTTAKSRTVNNTSYIDATVVGKPVTISEASIRSDLLFDDADGIDSLNNQAIFDNIQLMGPTSDTTHIPDSIPEGSGGNYEGQSSNDASLSGNEDGQKAKERSQTTYHTSQSIDEDKIGKEDFSEEKGVHNEYISKQGRKYVKSFKGEPSAHKDPAFDNLDDIVDDTLDYIEIEDAQDEGRISSVMLEEKENADKEVSTEAPVSIVKPNKGTDKKNEGTDKQDRSTDNTKVSTDRHGKDDETISQVLITMSQNKQKEKEKGVEIWNIKDTERPRPTSTKSILTLRPLPKIDPKDKGKKRIKEEDESDTKSEAIKVQEEWEAEEEKKRLAEEEATKHDETKEIEDVYLNVVIRSNRQRRYFSTLMAVLSILDRDDICDIYQLVMNRYQDETPEGFDKILWGDLIIMFNQKNKYPLKKEVLSKLLELKLETEEDGTMALELIRFVKDQIVELEPKDSDGDEKDP